jgi:hypothetical protein
MQEWRVRVGPMKAVMSFTIFRRMIAIAAIASLGLFGAIILANEKGQNGDRDRAPHIRFAARDRENEGDWYKEHRDDLPVGFRQEDRLTPSLESRLRVGEVLDPELRGRTEPVAGELLQKLPVAPRNYRYAVLAGHLLLVEEKTWNVSDVFHFELDFGCP